MNAPLFMSVKRLTMVCVAVLAACILLAPAAANATPYIVMLRERGNFVYAIGSGMIDLNGLTLYTTGTGEALVAPSYADFGSGSESVTDDYTGFSGPTSFGSGDLTIADAGDGNYVAIEGNPSYAGLPLLFVDAGYVSDTPLLNDAIWYNSSFASLGATPGIYKWTWGRRADQSFTLDIGVPEPAALGMFGVGVLLLGTFVGIRRRVG